jgi:hypothetical protein
MDETKYKCSDINSVLYLNGIIRKFGKSSSLTRVDYRKIGKSKTKTTHLVTAQDILGKPARREDFGLPHDWARVRSWIDFRGEIKLKKMDISGQKNLKWPEIPALEDYKISPNPSFWEKFPKKDLPISAETEINVRALEEKVIALRSSMTIHQFERSMKAVDYLKNGAPAFQKNTLPGCFVKNADSTLRYGREITDNIAT